MRDLLNSIFSKAFFKSSPRAKRLPKHRPAIVAFQSCQVFQESPTFKKTRARSCSAARSCTSVKAPPSSRSSGPLLSQAAMTTSLRSRAEFLRKLTDFDLSEHAKLFTEAEPAGLGIFTMQRMAQACGANHDLVQQEKITTLIEDPLVSKGLPEISRLDARAPSTGSVCMLRSRKTGIVSPSTRMSSYSPSTKGKGRKDEVC